MSRKLFNFARNAFNNEAGQILPWIAVAFVAALGVTGLALDMGHAYIVQKQLQIGANAAALAGAQALPADPTNQVLQYSGWQPTDNNYSTAIGALNKPVVAGKCLTTLSTNGIPCLNPSGFNAVQVTQSVNVPTMFMRALDFLPGVHLDTLPVSATATAGRSKPYPINVAIIVDMTGSLDVPENNDPDCSSSNMEYQCQLYAVQAMLGVLQPCSDGSMGTKCTADKAEVRVGLFTFPNVSSDATTLQNEISCGGNPGAPSGSNYTTNIVPEPYTFPDPAATDYSTAGLNYTNTAVSPTKIPSLSATYQVVGFSSDYYDTSQPNNLNISSSNLVKAVGSGTVKGCLNFPSGVVNTGIGNTYLASSIYAAQAALQGVQALYSSKKSTNYLIFISDGQSNAGNSGGTNQMVTVSGGSIRNNTNPGVPGIWPTFIPGSVSSSSPIGTGLAGLTALMTGAKDGTYPSYDDQCQQAIAAAAIASKTSTVISVANGAPGSGGCSDNSASSVVPNGSSFYVPITSGSSVTACGTMKDIATTIQSFYSTTQSGCIDPLLSTTHKNANTLKSIFENMSFGLVRATLIPNTTS